MISILLRDLRGRLVWLALLGVLLYFLEPAFHQHDRAMMDPETAQQLGPMGVSATLAYLAGLSMIVLLAGFISGDRREGHARIFFSHPTSPLALYALRWALALVLALATAAIFLVVGQWVAWGEVMGGAPGLLLALMAALVYGSLMAFFSSVLPRGDAWVVFLLFLPTFFPQVLTMLELTMGSTAHGVATFLLPPQGALQSIYQALLLGEAAWGAIAFIVGYAAVWLVAAGLIVRLRE